MQTFEKCFVFYSTYYCYLALILDFVFLSLPVRHGFFNEAYDNLDSMNMTPIERTAQPANHTQAPTQQVPAQGPVAYFTGIN